MKKSALDLTGDDELMDKLAQLAKKDIKKAIRKGSRAGQKIVQKEAKDQAPKDSGKLKKAIKVRALPRSRVKIGATTVIKDVPYAGIVQFGSKDRKADPFMEVAAENKGDKATKEAAQIIKDQIIEATKLK